MLREDASRPRKEKRTAQRLHDALVRAGFGGSYPTVQRFVKAWIEEQRHSPGSVFIPQSYAPGEAYQFDWSYETVDLGGRPAAVKVAHLRLCHSRVFLAVAYLREAQEMVFDILCLEGEARQGVCLHGTVVREEGERVWRCLMCDAELGDGERPAYGDGPSGV